MQDQWILFINYCWEKKILTLLWMKMVSNGNQFKSKIRWVFSRIFTQFVLLPWYFNYENKDKVNLKDFPLELYFVYRSINKAIKVRKFRTRHYFILQKTCHCPSHCKWIFLVVGYILQASHIASVMPIPLLQQQIRNCLKSWTLWIFYTDSHSKLLWTKHIHTNSNYEYHQGLNIINAPSRPELEERGHKVFWNPRERSGSPVFERQLKFWFLWSTKQRLTRLKKYNFSPFLRLKHQL